jgi:hypothetical protein
LEPCVVAYALLVHLGARCDAVDRHVKELAWAHRREDAL